MVVAARRPVPHEHRDPPSLSRGEGAPRGAATRRRRINVEIYQLMDRLCAEVTDTRRDVFRKLPFYREIPRLNVAPVQRAAPGTARPHSDRRRKRDDARARIGQRNRRYAHVDGIDPSVWAG